MYVPSDTALMINDVNFKRGGPYEKQICHPLMTKLRTLMAVLVVMFEILRWLSW